MDKQLKKIYLYIGIFVAIIFIGATYAFFTAGMSSETSTTVRADAGTMKITYDGGANINLAGIYPKDDVWATKTITVTGNNTTDTEMYYKLTLVVDSNTFKTDDPLQYELVSTNTSTNGEVIPNKSKTDITGTSIELGKGYFAKANNASHTYELKIYYPRKATSQNTNQGASFSAHVEITSTKAPTEPTFADTILANNEVKAPITTPGTEISAHTKDDVERKSIRSVWSTYQKYYIIYGTGYEANGINRFNLTGAAVTSDTYANSYSSLVGKYLLDSPFANAEITTAEIIERTTDLSSVYYVVSATSDSYTYKKIRSNKNASEALLASTPDDYGTSYYFRGAVKNNYVEFANKCWRVVRVGGDGSVKLILHNNNDYDAAKPCDTANNYIRAAFARYSGNREESKFNEKSDDNAYAGFKFGTPGSSTYEATHANTNKSTILTNLETWYNNNLSDYAYKIADTVWCNDKTIVKDTTYNPIANGRKPTGLGYGTNDTYYGATQRLVSASNRAGGTGPSLKCNGELSKITSKIGLITADELAFAGYAAELYNATTYLQENTGDVSWWSLSPSDHYGRIVSIWEVGGDDGWLSSSGASIAYGVRPSISLKPSTNVTGNGTSSTPYIVKY